MADMTWLEFMPESLRVTCPECGGKGECYTSHAWTCYDCDGRGWVPKDGVKEMIQQLKGK